MREWAERILEGDARALARAATAIEDGGADDLLHELAGGGGRALVVGITGPPGAGKSTLVDALVKLYRERGQRVAVIAVDPTSPVSGGAILGDRVRMQRHHGDPGVFIRSLATRGAHGGLSRAVRGTVELFDAAGWEVILIETVGVGQGEVEIARLAAVTVVVLVPGTGDDIQAMKAGILEVASILAINKADLAGADKLEIELHAESEAPIVRTVATEGTGVEELVRVIANCRRTDAGQKTGGRPEGLFYLDHLGIAVGSIEEALPFWRDQLGIAVSLRDAVEQEKVNVAMLPVGEPRIELIEATEADSVIARFVEKRGPGLHHVALRVRNFDEVLARLRAAGARLLNEPRRGAGGHIYVFLHPESTGGVLLELIQEEPER